MHSHIHYLQKRKYETILRNIYAGLQQERERQALLTSDDVHINTLRFGVGGRASVES